MNWVHWAEALRMTLAYRTTSLVTVHQRLGSKAPELGFIPDMQLWMKRYNLVRPTSACHVIATPATQQSGIHHSCLSSSDDDVMWTYILSPTAVTIVLDHNKNTQNTFFCSKDLVKLVSEVSFATRQVNFFVRRVTPSPKSSDSGVANCPSTHGHIVNPMGWRMQSLSRAMPGYQPVRAAETKDMGETAFSGPSPDRNAIATKSKNEPRKHTPTQNLDQSIIETPGNTEPRKQTPTQNLDQSIIETPGNTEPIKHTPKNLNQRNTEPRKQTPKNLDQSIIETPGNTEPRKQTPTQNLDQSIIKTPGNTESRKQTPKNLDQSITKTPGNTEPRKQTPKNLDQSIIETQGNTEPRKQTPTQNLDQSIIKTPGITGPRKQTPSKNLDQSLTETPENTEPRKQTPTQNLDQSIIKTPGNTEPRKQTPKNLDQSITETPENTEPRKQTPTQNLDQSIIETPGTLNQENKLQLRTWTRV
ncbi:hypothetical protein J6590_010193 [Homalodisca vitripennis]|nr:hypothetical protein J6590_010193 [Homalodisca vitripennis]